MMGNITLWWRGREPRERVLLSIMGALIAGIGLWLGVYRPVEGALRDAALANLEAAERYGEIARKVGLLQSRKEGATPAPSLPMDQVVGQSAGEVGFTLERVQAQGQDRVEIAIASARSTALMGWIAALEVQGVSVDRAMIRPSGVTGTVSAQITFKRSDS